MSGGSSETESSQLLADTLKESRAAEKTYAQIAEEQWARSQEAYAPLENQYMEWATTDQGDREKVTGKAAADVAQSLGSASSVVAEMGASGANPASGRSLMTMAKAGNEFSSTLSKNAAAASTAADLLEYERLQRLVDLGKGQGEEAQLGIGSVANLKSSSESALNSSSLSDAKNNLYTTSSLLSSLGSLSGLSSLYSSK